MDPKNNVNVTLDDMVFETRNRAYGAYDLRKAYKKTVNRSLLYGTVAFLAAIGAPMLYASIQPKAKKEVAVEIDLTKLKEEKVEDKPLDLPPPPPPEQKPPEVQTIKFLPPEPKPDEEVKNEEPPPPAEQIEKAVISNETKEGIESDEVAAAPPVVEAPKAVEIEQPKEDEIFTTVEQNPEFPGGIKEMYGFIGKNLKYPSAAQRANVSGKVFAKFVVEKDGSLGDVQILKGIGFGCDEEAQRVLKSMPKWNPGKQNGRNVRVFFTMPISFVLE
jgi:periplasmic protein TonB